MSENNNVQVSQTEIEELRKLADISEFHAHSVRQLISQRSRLFEIIKLAGEVADFPKPAFSGFLGSSAADLKDIVALVETSNSQFLQDVFCLLLNRGKRNGFFVEFGACDGLLISNTVLLEREFGWTGILSEPSRHWQDSIRKNRNCIIDNRCVWKQTGERIEFAEFTNDDYSTQSGILQTSESGLQVSSSYQVETISLGDLLQAHKAPNHIDFMSIDTEGSEFEILQVFPFDKYSFGFIAVEHKTPETEGPIKDLLEKNGYKQTFRSVSGHDGFYLPCK
jgi:FkbM family methyltransferase